MTRLVVLLLLALASFPAANAAVEDSASVITGEALYGVDELGRFLVAVDSHPLDGLADTCLLFTASERVAGGPWSRRAQVRVVHKDDGTLSLRESPPFFVVSLALSGIDPPAQGNPPQAEEFALHDGLELVALHAGPAGGAALDQMDIGHLATWPEAFWYDYHDPASAQCPSDHDCSAGGEGACACSIGCGAGLSCSVNCSPSSCPESQFACCKCLMFGSSCRCRQCIPAP